jgi:hypothetical protein
VTPSAFDGDGPAVAFQRYDPRTGGYLTTDGQMRTQTNLVGADKSWKDMLPS